LGGNSAPGLSPAKPGAFATPAPASVADAPPLSPHEAFGFVPYWELGDSAGFDLSGLTTIDYFAIGINPDGSLSNSGAGSQGYGSQNFIDLIDRAHAAGKRVVVTVTDFSQTSLDQLALSSSAPQTLAESVLYLVKARSLDGVNLDLEGQGSGDQAGITNLVKVVSQTLKAANPGYQVTIDTYASSAVDATGFYDVTALSPYVDGFFVMAYQLNLASPLSSESTLTSSMISNQTALDGYISAVSPGKVILGLPFFGFDWPTTNGTLTAQATGGPTVVTDEQETATGRPMYWDPFTDSAWTSYQVGSQWHEAFFENPNSLYLESQMAQDDGIAGVGVWALGLEGSDGQAMLSALGGKAPPQKYLLTGPPSDSAALAWAGLVAPDRLPGPTHRPETTTTTTTTAPSTAPPPPVPYTYAGTWLGAQTRVLGSAFPKRLSTLEGTMTNFQTADPNLQCLDSEPALDVYHFPSDPTHDYVIARKSAGDCADVAFIFEIALVPTLYTYAGSWNGVQTGLIGTVAPGGASSAHGKLTGFVTADPNLQCLSNESALDVYHFPSDPTHNYVIARKSAGDCADAAFVFVPSAS